MLVSLVRGGPPRLLLPVCTPSIRGKGCEHQIHKGYPFPSPDPACTWVLVSSCDLLACWGSSSAAVSTLVARLSFPGDH